jgi:serine/threonine protein phosphatase PrpC
MLIQQDNHPPVTSHQAGGQTLTSAGVGVHAGRPALTLEVGTDLDPGIRRRQEPNEDTLSVTRGVIPAISLRPFVLLIVADGMGGQADGQEASQLAVQSLSEYVSASLRVQQATSETFLPLLKAGVQYANRVLYQRNQEQRTDMGTTMTTTLVVDATAYVAHVGDSRFYLFRKPMGLSQISQDHSLVAALAAAGIIRPEDIYTHPRRNLIYRCLGEKSPVEVDTYVVPLAAGDILLLCSDGLWEMVRDPQIATILTSPTGDPSHTAHALIQAALAGGGEDNVSALVARVSNV